MNRLYKIEIDKKEIIVIDYSDLKEVDIMVLASQSLQLVLYDNRPAAIMSIFNERNYGTRKVIKHMEEVNRKHMHLVEKQALLGLTATQKIILKGFNLILQRDIKAFATKEEAIAYLTHG
jgi:hypothetical protein